MRARFCTIVCILALAGCGVAQKPIAPARIPAAIDAGGIKVMFRSSASAVSSLTAMAPNDSQLARVRALAGAPIPLTEDEWRRRLTPAQFTILRQQGTEAPFSSPLDTEVRPGTYYGADCGEPLFRSEQKYDSGTGWPSFWAPMDPKAVLLKSDTSLGMDRTEVVSAKCGGHLGHVFDDGPQPTGKRYCMNGTALIFVPDTLTKQ